MALLSGCALLVMLVLPNRMIEGKACVFSFGFLSFSALFIQPGLRVLPAALISDAAKERKAFKKL